jgi:hypothetical protein
MTRSQYATICFAASTKLTTAGTRMPASFTKWAAYTPHDVDADVLMVLLRAVVITMDRYGISVDEITTGLAGSLAALKKSRATAKRRKR